MPVPSNLQASAPTQIPLWSFNNELGLWVEESVATLQGDKYVGEVSHFSFWNCDITFSIVQLDMQFVDGNGIPIVNQMVTASLNNNAITLSGYTDNDGNVTGLFPANEELTLELLDFCGVSIFTQTIGPFSADTDLGTYTVSNSSINSTTISGNLLDCNGAPLTNGVIQFSFGGQTVYHYATTSNFSATFSTCSSIDDIEVVGIDLVNIEQSNPIIASSNTSNDIGDISACGFVLPNYIRINVDGIEKVYPCLLYTSPSPRDATLSRMPSSA